MIVRRPCFFENAERHFAQRPGRSNAQAPERNKRMNQPCTCPPTISHVSELCEACKRELINHLEEEAFDARIEAMLMGSELLAAAEEKAA